MREVFYYDLLKTCAKYLLVKSHDKIFIYFKEFNFSATVQTGWNGDLHTDLKIHTPRTALNITKKVLEGY